MFNHADTQAKTSSQPSLFTVLPGPVPAPAPRERGSVPDPPPSSVVYSGDAHDAEARTRYFLPRRITVGPSSPGLLAQLLGGSLR
jgi:hypothetical protein